MPFFFTHSAPFVQWKKRTLAKAVYGSTFVSDHWWMAGEMAFIAFLLVWKEIFGLILAWTFSTSQCHGAIMRSPAFCERLSDSGGLARLPACPMASGPP
ncbi:hypothetical protein AVEN_187875-1 [Araneus ventricosus]|uniref:Uncharacterized protein n=1 Tax=Araneus ventricosus TaxID=182803 RepID=A0A4Y2CUG5_ARAVE|nr:hypothetical protein AVEN_187875-1 [Araneus ventricosus]